VRVLLLDRPALRNAVDLDLVESLHAAIDTASGDERTRTIVIGSAHPGMFCAGADLTIPDAERARVSERLYALYEKLLRSDLPVIAAVDGAAVGGGAQLVLAADIRLLSGRARLRLAGPGHGLAVGAWALPSLVGRDRAMRLILDQTFIGAEQAVQSGLANEIAADPLGEALRLAERIRDLDRSAVTRSKRIVVDGERLTERLTAERAGNRAVFTGAVPRTAAGTVTT
jgi:enoyl-CoA hydratase/carnithine racemase